MNNITTLKPKEGVELLAIVVDKDAYDFSIDNNKKYISATIEKDGWNNKDWFSDKIYNIDNYSILGCIEYNKLIEFDCDEILLKGKRKEELDFGVYDEYETYFDYTTSVMRRFITNERCFISLLEANNINLQQLDKDNKKLVILIKQ